MARIGGFNSGSSSNQVILNVYDLHENNDVLHPWGLGFFHSGVQVGREEYTFASSAGIFSHAPRNAAGARFRESIDMGVFKGTSKDLETILQSLRPQFKGDDYHILNNNCNNFANALLIKLVGKEAPGYVNRMAYFGSFCSCLMPPQAANNAPVDNGNTRDSHAYAPVSNPAYQYKAGRNTPSATSSTVFTAPGRKIGSSSEPTSTTAGMELQQDRRERMRVAAATRLSGTNNGR